MAKPKKEGKKNRKIGRAARKPAHTSYTRERRWETNKERRMARQAKFEANLPPKPEKFRPSPYRSIRGA